MGVPVGTLLKEWQSYAETISKNVMELSDQTDVKLIKLMGKDTASGYTGLTKARAARALEDLETLWRYYIILSNVIDKAEDLYSKNSFFNNTEDEIRELLENAPVTLETKHIDISDRSLLTPEKKDTKVTLRQLLKFMQESFETTRNTFNEISRATKDIQQRLLGIKDEINNLNNNALRFGLKDMPRLAMPEIIKVETDPLQGMEALDALFYRVEKYRASIKSVMEDYNETVNVLRSVEAMLNEMKELKEKSEDVIEESREIFKSQYSPKPTIEDEVLKSLKDWLDVLQGKLSEGGLSAAKVGAKRLESECSMKLNTERENYFQNSKDYNEWLELKGRFNALVAKLNSLRARCSIFDESLSTLIEETRMELYADSVNLDVCRKLLEKFYMSLKR